jgi:hypothetical protein
VEVAGDRPVTAPDAPAPEPDGKVIHEGPNEPDQPKAGPVQPEPEPKPEDPVKTGRDVAGRLGGEADQSRQDEYEGDWMRTQILHIYGGNTFTGPTSTGDVVGGDQTKWRGDVGPHAARAGGGPGNVNAETLRKVRAVYVTRPPYERAEHVLGEHHVVVIAGPHGVGKLATSLHLLSGTEARPVLEIPKLDAQELYNFAFQEGRRYVINKFRDPVEASILERLTGVLAKSTGRLVITVDEPTPDKRCDERVVRFTDVPKSPTVLARNVRWHLNGVVAETDPDKLCREASVTAELETALTAADVEQLAITLARVARGGLDLEDALRQNRVRASHEVLDWFQTNGADLARTSFLIAAAVLHDASFESAASAAAALHEAFWAHERHGRRPLSRSIFNHPRDVPLDAIEATVVKRDHWTQFGSGPVEVIRLTNESWRREVVGHVWREYPLARRCLTDWLLALGRDGGLDVRLRAGVAVGELLEDDFLYIYDELLWPWVKDNTRATRDVIRYALGVGAHSEASPLVLKLLERWTSKGDHRVKAAGAAALGGNAALRDPNSALSRLETMVEKEATDRTTLVTMLDDNDDGLELLREVNRSLTRLFNIGDDFHLALLDALVRWSERKKPALMGTLTCFFFVDLARLSRLRAPGGTVGEWPRLLWLMGDSRYRENDRLMKQALALWTRSFRMAYTRQTALEVLNEWVLWADKLPDAYETMEWVVLAIIAALPAGESERVLFSLAREERNARTPSASRGRLAARLQRGA